MKDPHPRLNVFTGARPPQYTARYDRARNRWRVFENGRPVSVGRVLATEQEAMDEVARIAALRFAGVGTFPIWPETELAGPERYLVIPPPPPHMFVGPERGLVQLGRLKLN